MKLPIFQLNIDEFDDETGMFLISMVDRPAMQVAAVKLAEEATLVTLKATNADKQYLTSAVIIPGKLILRSDAQRGDYYIQFTVEDVEKIRNKFFQRTGNLSLSNKNHVETDTVQAQLIESWIIEDPKMDKATALGFNLPKGTMMATYKVLDAKFWTEEVLTNNVTGFSLEGCFTETPVKLTENPSVLDELLAILDEIEETDHA